MFPGSFSRNCAWLALEGCRIRAKRLSTNSHNIVSLQLKVQKQRFRCKNASAGKPSVKIIQDGKDCHLINRIFHGEKSSLAVPSLDRSGARALS
jgi:hypothetical protein